MAAERKAAADHLAAHPPVHACPECEDERVTGMIHSQHKHTCHQVLEDELIGRLLQLDGDSEGLAPRLRAGQTVVDSSQGAVGSCDLASEPEQFTVDTI